MNQPTDWTNAVSKATWTLLLAMLAVFVMWQLVRQLWPAVVVLAVLLGIYRMLLMELTRDLGHGLL